MKAYTDIEQSKKLAEILPVKSADMCYIKENWYDSDDDKWHEDDVLMVDTKENVDNMIPQHITFPCWSLAALLGVYPMIVGRDMGMYCCWQNSKNLHSRHYDNPVDACYEMILKLKENDLL